MARTRRAPPERSLPNWPAAAAGAPNPHARNGGEFGKHARVTEKTSVKVYFCDPGCPGQRGSIENTHGRLRAPLPRRTDLAEISDAEIARLVHNLNAMPRKCLGWRTPLEAFSRGLEAELRHGFTVALGT